MNNHVEFFKMHLVEGQSVGPDALRVLWSRACESSDVSVSRQSRRTAYGMKDVYSLSAPPRMKDQPMIESRLKMLLLESRLTASVTSVHV
ncbi:hypothetical protein BH23PSE2_BH23PSE2_07150 [soil metagenome]